MNIKTTQIIKTIDVIEIEDSNDDDDDDENGNGKLVKKHARSDQKVDEEGNNRYGLRQTQYRSSRVQTPNAKKVRREWSCTSCTYLNPTRRRKCEMCNSPKPKPKEEEVPSSSPPDKVKSEKQDSGKSADESLSPDTIPSVVPSAVSCNDTVLVKSDEPSSSSAAATSMVSLPKVEEERDLTSANNEPKAEANNNEESMTPPVTPCGGLKAEEDQCSATDDTEPNETQTVLPKLENQEEGTSTSSATNTTSTNVTAVSVPTTSSQSNSNDNEVIEVLNEDAEIKKEFFQMCGSINKASMRRTTKRLMRQRFQTDANNNPRCVFRRGCNKACISTILGGAGTHPYAMPKNIPHLIYDEGELRSVQKKRQDGQQPHNPFITKGEFFVGGRSDWNPWTPFFAGDDGFVSNEAFQVQQKEFHLFLHCATKAHEPYYHGEEAKGKYLYLGRYCRDTESEIDKIVEAFKTLKSETQFTMAERYGNLYRAGSNKRFNVKNIHGEIKGKVNGGDLEERHFTSAKLGYNDDNDSEHAWDNLSEDKQSIYAWIEMLCEVDHHIILVPVEFVSYDEELYKALVSIGANNGVVSVNDDELGPI